LQENKLLRDLTFSEGCSKINVETKDKLVFLNTTWNSSAANDEVAGGHNKGSRLDTINEALDSTRWWWDQSFE
jgi:hypothetical protein